MSGLGLVLVMWVMLAHAVRLVHAVGRPLHLQRRKCNCPCSLPSLYTPGGAVGGGVGAIVAVAVLVFLIKRRRSAGDSGSGGLRATWSNPTYGATATVAAGAGPQKFELESVVEQTGTPSSARRRNATPFNG